MKSYSIKWRRGWGVRKWKIFLFSRMQLTSFPHSAPRIMFSSSIKHNIIISSYNIHRRHKVILWFCDQKFKSSKRKVGCVSPLNEPFPPIHYSDSLTPILSLNFRLLSLFSSLHWQERLYCLWALPSRSWRKSSRNIEISLQRYNHAASSNQ